MRVCLFLLLLYFLPFRSSAQIAYPFPGRSITITIDDIDNKLAYMDVKADHPNGQTVVLLHGKNFTGLYWKNVIIALSRSGYRVIVPDQIGWGRSSKPNIKYSFEMLASTNRQLLDSLNIDKAIVIGHSMGGMLAVRFALAYPERTSKLVLEDPLGLEDYKKFVPYKTMDQQYRKELNATYTTYKKYQQSYYPLWKPSYELYVQQQAEPLKQKDFNSVAYVNALTYQMIYEQPVFYELNRLTTPTLIIVGELDRTIFGKDILTAKQLKGHGNFPVLAKKARARIHNCKLVVLPGVGHIPHIESNTLFDNTLVKFLNNSP